MSRTQLLKVVASRVLGFVVMMMLFLFLPAGTWNYWQAWAYMGLLLIPMFFVMVYLIRNDPELLERRMRLREQRSEQKRIVKISLIFFLLAYILPGFDIRFGWSNVPVWVSIVADVLILLGYWIVVRVFQVNSYASRVIEINSGQKVIDTDVYAIVRHPMYFGAILMYVLSPLALGSYWAMIPGAMIVPTLVVRILDEETALEKDLPGYIEYKLKTKYRLIPFVW
jgi:protein-S-isoprenylcysteine O-methyltransferase Ste14